MADALTIEQVFDSIAIRVNGPRAWSEGLTIDWHFLDEKARFRMALSNGALVHWPDPDGEAVDLTLTLTRPQLRGLLEGGGLEGVQTDGDPAVLRRLLTVLDRPDPEFAIVTP
jgi:alkyl sulfatase BDS1-like metallo-beta-lactamase superfamily hydrolase